MSKQYFYLVVYTYNGYKSPQKIFLQKHEAVKWGRREATKVSLAMGDKIYSYSLYEQVINRTDTLKKVMILEPYKTKEHEG